MSERFDQELDTAGLLCPLPLLKAQKALKLLVSGAVLKVIATDPSTQQDFSDFCAQTGHQLLCKEQKDDCFYFYIQKR